MTPKNYFAMPGMLTKDIIIHVVCSEYRANKEEVLGSCRKRELCEPRQVIAALARKYLSKQVSSRNDTITQKHSLQDIGNMFRPPKDHATVLHSVKVVGNLYAHDKGFREIYDRIKVHLSLYGVVEVETVAPKGTVRDRILIDAP